MLTNAAVKAARPRARAYKLGDAQGLYLHVAPTGTRSFRLKFRLGGRELLLTFGCWPEISLADARVRRDAARARLGRGEDPRIVLATSTFEAVARAWHAARAPRWSPAHAADVLASLERDVFPTIGAIDPSAIDGTMLLALLQGVERRGAAETARRLRQRLAMIFTFAIARDQAAENPAAPLAPELAGAVLVRRQPALLDIVDARELLASAERVAAAPAIKLASRFLAITGVRLAALRGMTWSEVSGVDWSRIGDDINPTWRVPAARMKLAAAKKTDAGHDHVVPLAPAAVAVLRAAREDGHDTRSPDALVFVGRDGRSPIGEAAIGNLYARAGYRGRHVPHGWRSTFATIMNEAHPQHRGAIDRALAHAPKDKVEAAYNRSAGREVELVQRRWLLERWAVLLLGT